MSESSNRKVSLSGPWPTLLGLLTVGLGVLALAAPLVSRNALLVAVAVGALAAGALLLLTRSERRWQLVGVLWLAIGVAATFWPGHPFPVLSILTGIGLLGSGAIGVFAAFTVKPRAWGPILVGIALTIAGIAVIGWSDISILAATLALGIYLLTLGVDYLLNHDSTSPNRDWGTLRTIGAGALTLLAVALLAVGGWFRVTATPPTSFYDPPTDVPAEPGQLLRAEPYTNGIPDTAQAWRILYTTTRDDDTPAVASGIVMVPVDAGPDPLPVITWAHGTTGFDPSCAPSLMESSLESGAFFLAEEVVAQGWALVATDYLGLGTEGPHPYLIGEPEGRSVLDATRAARQLTDVSLSDETVVWGHSQGGHAALWAGQLASTYAPDTGVIGVAALAPASNLPALLEGLETNVAGPLFGSFVVEAYAETYDDVDFDDVVTPRNQVFMRELASRCLGGREILLTLGQVSVLGTDVWNGNPMSGTLGPRIQENVPLAPIEVPLLIGQGLDDQLVLPSAQEAYVAQRCELGTTLDFRTYEGRDHVPLVEEDSPLVPELIQWTEDRLNGVAASTTC